MNSTAAGNRHLGAIAASRAALQKLAALAVLVLGMIAAGSAAAAPPPAPPILAPANAASVTVPFMLAWSPVISNPSGVVAYNWQVSTSSTFTPLIDMDSTDGLTTQDSVSGLVNGTYFWRVQAVNQAGEQGAFSAARSFTVTGVGVGTPATPVLAPTQGYNTFHPFEAVTFNWSAVANAPTYRLEFSTDANFALGTPATSWSDNLRTPTDRLAFADPGNYFARVFATDSDFSGGIRSLPSNVIHFSVAFNNPIGPAPALVSPVSGETLTLLVTLKWAHVPNLAVAPAIGGQKDHAGASTARDVILSGACSSGANKTKTCTFTIPSNAAVTGNLQQGKLRAATTESAPGSAVSVLRSVLPCVALRERNFNGRNQYTEFGLRGDIPAEPLFLGEVR